MTIDLPIIVCGENIQGDNRDKLTINMENGVKVRFPVLTEKDVNAIIDSRLRTGLHETHFDDIALLFQKVSQYWFRSENTLRDEACKLGYLVTGYPEKIIYRDYRMLNELFIHRGQMYDQLEAELGNRWYLDEWVPNQNCIVHAQPRGLVTNILVGNIPISSTFGIYRSLVVKNNTLCKLPKRDPIGALYYAKSFIEVAPNHPLTKSLSVVYWERDSWQEEKLLNASDAVCVWGGEQAIDEIKKKIRSGTHLLEYGPKRSLSMVDLTTIEPSDSLETIAIRLGHDFSVYNQEACFTSQELYIVADDQTFFEFINKLQAAMNHYLELYPKGEIMIDNKAHVYITRTEQMFDGSTVIATKNHNWTIIISKDKNRIKSHPLCRTIVIHRINNLEEAVKFTNRYTQTVTMYPLRKAVSFREALTLNGVDRIVSIGMANFPRIGFPHDGIWTFNQLVRWVNIERDIDCKGKYLDMDKERYVKRLFYQGKEALEYKS